jgi:hypothetical protein
VNCITATLEFFTSKWNESSKFQMGELGIKKTKREKAHENKML